jgi:hypothetical protein
MFVGTDVIEFINKIINQSDLRDKQQVKQNITKFREYLRLTCMADEATLTDIDLILSCIDELMVVKSKLGSVDVMSIFEGRGETKTQPRRLAKTKQSSYDEKHYRHYSGGSNSSCGSSSFSSSNCGSTPSYSSSCGGSSPTYRSC